MAYKYRRVAVKTRAHGHHRYPVKISAHSDHTIMERTFVALAIEGPVNTYYYLSPNEARQIAAGLVEAATKTEKAIRERASRG